jgi:hypothetical protein
MSFRSTALCMKSNYVVSKKLLFSLLVTLDAYCGGAWWSSCGCDSFPILHRGLDFRCWVTVFLRSFAILFAVALFVPRPLPSASNEVFLCASVKLLPSIIYGAGSKFSLKFVPWALPMICDQDSAAAGAAIGFPWRAFLNICFCLSKSLDHNISELLPVCRNFCTTKGSL